jgi:hypothetical protein
MFWVLSWGQYVPHKRTAYTKRPIPPLVEGGPISKQVHVENKKILVIDLEQACNQE